MAHCMELGILSVLLWHLDSFLALVGSVGDRLVVVVVLLGHVLHMFA